MRRSVIPWPAPLLTMLLLGCAGSAEGVPGGNSLAAGTPIVLRSGPVPIEDVAVGDEVLSYDPATGEWSYQPVLAVSSREAREPIVTVDYPGGRFRASTDHVVLVSSAANERGPHVRIVGNASLSRAQDLMENDELRSRDGGVGVRSVRIAERRERLHSIVVGGNHTYAVGDERIVVGDSTIGVSPYGSRYGYPRAGGGACFPAGTRVTTPDGTAPIESLAAGDAVEGYDPDTGRSERRTVSATPVHDYRGDIVTLSIAGETIRATGNHPFLVIEGRSLARRPAPEDVPRNELTPRSGGRWVEARSLRTGDRLALVEGGTATVDDVSTEHASETVYNLTVDELHTYAVGTSGLVVHNKGSAETAAAPMTSAEPAVVERARSAPPVFNTESYDRIFEPGFKRVVDEPLSTLSIDVDTASYSNTRRFLTQGSFPPPDAVRIEELINYFTYEYPDPAGAHPFNVTTELSECPWNEENLLLQVGMQAERVAFGELPPSNLVFLLDVSGSMNAPNKLPLLKESILALLDELRDVDHVSIVVYAGSAGLVLPPTPCTQKDVIARALDELEAGGSTAGGEGIRLAYSVAQEHFDPNGNNRVILGTDGDFNVGPSSQGALQRIIEEEREKGVYLTVLGFGMGNYKDDRMETLADSGNGNYAYIDTINEARKVLVQEIAGTLYTLANDVKIQIEFNPTVVDAYRTVGYENRLLEAEEFADDQTDAGELGAGHSVTVLYELRPASGAEPAERDLRYQSSRPSPEAAASGELMFLKMRYKPLGETESTLIEYPVPFTRTATERVSRDFDLAASLAAFGMILRDSEFAGSATLDAVLAGLERSLVHDPFGYRREAIGLVKLAQWIPPEAEE
ncbi:MAG: YfbK domain-containing protein [Spirochaetota bacterium]